MNMSTLWPVDHEPEEAQSGLLSPHIEEANNLDSEADDKAISKEDEKKKAKALPWLIAGIVLAICLVPFKHLHDLMNSEHLIEKLESLMIFTQSVLWVTEQSNTQF